MGVFDFIKIKKPDQKGPSGPSGFPPMPPAGAPSGPPVDQVLQMQHQNMTNNQIVEALQRQGYDITTIMDAIAQAEAVGGVQQAAPGPLGPPMPQPPFPPPPAAGEPDMGHIEELVEKIVDERWQELQKELTKWNDWRDNVNIRLERMEQSHQDTRNDLDNLHKAIVNKIGEYDKNLIDVGTEIRAMEKVFQKVLPTLTENVNELTRVADQMKRPAPEPKKTTRSR